MTLREKLTQRIDAEQAEIARIKADAIINAEAALGRITVLRQAAAVLDGSPQIETLIGALHKMGIEI